MENDGKISIIAPNSQGNKRRTETQEA